MLDAFGMRIVIKELFFILLGTIISTLKKRSSSSNSIEYLPKYELVTFTKTSSIPTSHVHLNEPENVILACNVFRVSLNYNPSRDLIQFYMVSTITGTLL